MMREFFDFTALLRSRSDIAGIWNSIFVGEGGEFLNLRPYQPGDKLRKLHKPSFAREELLIKEFRGERHASVWLLFDVASSVASMGDHESLSAKPACDSMSLFSALVCGAAAFWGVPVGAAYLDNAQPRVMRPIQASRRFEEIVHNMRSISSGEFLDTAKRIRRFRENIRHAQKTLVFFVSDFYSDLNIFGEFFEECRDIHKIDILPVFIDTGWVWGLFQEGSWDFAGADVGTRYEGSMTIAKHTIPRIEHALEEHVGELQRTFRRLGIPWIHLKRPSSSIYIPEMTRCFSEKQRMLS